MRELNDFEKSVLRRMVMPVKEQDVCTITLFTEFTDTYAIRWDCSHLEVVYEKNKNWFSDIRQKIFDLITLLDYLETHKYIFIIPAEFLKENLIYDKSKYIIKGEFPSFSIMEKCGNISLDFDYRAIDGTTKKINGEYRQFAVKPFSVQQELTGMGEYIKKYANSTYHVTQSLKNFVIDGFKTKEQIRFEKTFKQSKFSIIIALIIGLGSLIIGIVNTCQNGHRPVQSYDGINEHEVIRSDTAYNMIRHMKVAKTNEIQD